MLSMADHVFLSDSSAGLPQLSLSWRDQSANSAAASNYSQSARSNSTWSHKMAGSDVKQLLGALLSTDNDIRTKAEVRVIIFSFSPSVSVFFPGILRSTPHRTEGEHFAGSYQQCRRDPRRG